MRSASLLLALAFGAALLSPAHAASLSKGTVELEGSVDFTHTAYVHTTANSVTDFGGSVGGAYSLTPLLQLGGGLLLTHHGVEFDDGFSISYSGYGASADVTANFGTPNNLIPFVRAGIGFESYSGDTFENAKTSLIAPYVRAGVRVLVGNSASVNLSASYRHITNADGEDGVDANVVGFAVGFSIFPIRGK